MKVNLKPIKGRNVGHTKGPWSLSQNGFIESGNVKVARILQNGFGYSATANANLIAASPELLEESQKLIAKIDSWEGTIPHSHTDGLRAAIAKATGAAP